MFALLFGLGITVWFYVEEIKIFIFEGLHNIIQEYSNERVVCFVIRTFGLKYDFFYIFSLFNTL